MTPLKLAEIEAEKRYPSNEITGSMQMNTPHDYRMELQRAAFIAGDQRDRWISVEDAPEDGRHYLATVGGIYLPFVAHYINKKWIAVDDGEECYPKFWQPLPPPPSNP